MATQVVRIGEAAAIEIPDEMLRRANLAVGDPVEWTVTPFGTLALRSPYDANTIAATDQSDYEDWKRREIEAGFAEIDAGDHVDGEKVAEWSRSLSTGKRLPPPL
jgi:predicted transcriptional regulator